MELEEGARNGRSNPGELKQMLATILANMFGFIAVVNFLMVRDSMKIKYGTLTRLGYQAVEIITILFSYLSCEYYGRKTTLYLSITSFIIYWSLIPFVEEPMWIKGFFCLHLFATAMCIFTLHLYVSEISCNRIRGTLVSICGIFGVLGYQISYLMMNLDKDWTLQQAASIAIFSLLIAMIGIHWIPESPIFLVQKSRIDEASRSLLWLRNNDEEYVRNELLEIEGTLQRIPNSGSCFGDGIETLKDLFRVSANRRSLLITIGLLLVLLMVEMAILPRLFREILSRRNDDILYASDVHTPILGMLLVTILVDYVGRRRLLLISSVMKLLELIIFYIFENFPITGMGNGSDAFICILGYAFIIAHCLGLATIPFIIAVEVFKRKVLCLGYMISLVFCRIVRIIYPWIQRTYILQMDTLVEELIQFVVRLCGTLFIYFFVPETKGKAIE